MTPQDEFVAAIQAQKDFLYQAGEQAKLAQKCIIKWWKKQPTITLQVIPRRKPNAIKHSVTWETRVFHIALRLGGQMPMLYDPKSNLSLYARPGWDTEAGSWACLRWPADLPIPEKAVEYPSVFSWR